MDGRSRRPVAAAARDGPVAPVGYLACVVSNGLDASPRSSARSSVYTERQPRGDGQASKVVGVGGTELGPTLADDDRNRRIDDVGLWHPAET